MTNTGAALLRWAGVFGLYLLIGLLIIPVMLAHWLGVGGLWVIEALASKANQLRGRGS